MTRNAYLNDITTVTNEDINAQIYVSGLSADTDRATPHRALRLDDRWPHPQSSNHHASDGECAVYIEPMHIIGLQWNYAFWMLVKVKRRLVLLGKPTITHQTITHQLHQRRMQERWDIGRR